MKQLPLLLAALITAVGSLEAQRGHRHSRNARSTHHLRGHWETRCQKVLVPGHWRTQHVPASYGWIYSGSGHRHWGRIRAAGCRRVWVPARWETRSRRVWVTR